MELYNDDAVIIQLLKVYVDNPVIRLNESFLTNSSLCMFQSASVMATAPV